MNVFNLKHYYTCVIKVRQLESELTASSKWAREIAACTSALEQRLQAVGPSKPPRVSLNVAEQLIATEPVCNNDNLAKLKVLVVSGDFLFLRALNLFLNPVSYANRRSK